MIARVPFDRIAHDYDRTRALPAALAARQTDLLQKAIGDSVPVLEIGVGTGRIAIPLARRGVPVVGIDISEPMLRVMQTRAGDTEPAAVLADATDLPFADRSFGSVIGCHVLHLIREWEVVVGEVRRVLRSGGAFLSSRAGSTGIRREVFTRYHEALTRPPRPVGTFDQEAIDVVARAAGFEITSLPELRHTDRFDLGALVDALEQGMYSSTWDIGWEERRRAGAATRRWLESRYGSQRPLVEDDWVVGWRAYVAP